MKKKAIYLVFAILFLFSCEGTKTVPIYIYYTNDIHGWIYPVEVMREDSTKALRGGFAVVQSYLNRVKDLYILVDAGDWFLGTPEGNLTRGASVVEIMDSMGYAVATVGNHEFDYGYKNILRLSNIAVFPFLCANLVDSVTGQVIKPFKPYEIKEINGVRIGFIGLLTTDASLITTWDIPRGKLIDPAEAANEYIKELKANKADIIIAVTHLGFEGDSAKANFKGDIYLANNANGIDVIIGGHSHTTLPKGYWVKNRRTFIVQSGSALRNLGELVIRYNLRKHKVVSAKTRLVPLWEDELGQDARIARIVKRYKDKIGAALDSVVGEADTNITRRTEGTPESPLGNWVADVIRQAGRAEIAFQNSGGIRADIPNGPVTKRTLYTVHPFDNTLVTMYLSGKSVRKIIELSLVNQYGGLQISGISVVYDTTREPMNRVVSILVNGKPLIDTRLYKVATNSYLAYGGEGYNIFSEGKSIKDTMKNIRDILTRYVRQNRKIHAKIEGRYKKLGGSGQPTKTSISHIYPATTRTR